VWDYGQRKPVAPELNALSGTESSSYRQKSDGDLLKLGEKQNKKGTKGAGESREKTGKTGAIFRGLGPNTL